MCAHLCACVSSNDGLFGAECKFEDMNFSLSVSYKDPIPGRVGGTVEITVPGNVSVAECLDVLSREVLLEQCDSSCVWPLPSPLTRT